MKCPNIKQHTKQPEDYLSFMNWAEKKINAGYKQIRCKGCGLFAIWKKKIK